MPTPSSGSTGGFFDKVKRRLEHEFLFIERNRQYSESQKVTRIIHTTAALCAAVAIQPIPFADMPILTGIQAFMGYKIAQVRGVPLSQQGVLEVLKYIGGVVGLGFAAQQTAIGLYKIGLPGLGGLMTIPLVAALTVGIGRAMDLYFVHKREGRVPSPEAIRKAFRAGKQEGRKVKPQQATLEDGGFHEPESRE